MLPEFKFCKPPCSADPPAVEIALSESGVQMKTSYPHAWKIVAGTIGVAAMVLSLAVLRGPFLRKAQAESERREKYLFVWAGDQARTNPDFLAVINFDEHSNRYGKV